jgi:cytochrome c-type biogenesis protein
MSDIGLLTAFLAGVASFLSPCVLPLVPGYLSFISGVSIEEMVESRTVHTGKVFLTSLLFVLGFSIIFVAMGATATALGSFIQDRISILNKIAGLLIILFGLHLTGLFRIKFLMVEKRYHGSVGGGFLGPVLLGMAFGFGWTPCVGPVLFAILAYAGTQETAGQGVVLLLIYSAGLGLPFLLTGVAMGSFIRFLDRFKRYFRWVELTSGLILVTLGFLVMTGYMSKLANLIPRDWILSG